MKQKLLDIKRKTDITTRAIAERANLSLGDVFTVETGGFISREKAQQVLTAFNRLSGMQVMLADIQLHTTSRNYDRSFER